MTPPKRCPRRWCWTTSGTRSSMSQVLWVWRRSWKCIPGWIGGHPRRGSPVRAGSQTRRRKLERRCSPPSAPVNTNGRAVRAVRWWRSWSSRSMRNGGRWIVRALAGVLGGPSCSRPLISCSAPSCGVDADLAPVEVDVVPLQPGQLAPAHAGVGGGDDQYRVGWDTRAASRRPLRRAVRAFGAACAVLRRSLWQGLAPISPSSTASPRIIDSSPATSAWSAPRIPDSCFGSYLCCELLIQVLVVDLLRGSVAERRVETFRIVAELDVSGHICAGVFACRIDSAVDSLHLQ